MRDDALESMYTQLASLYHQARATGHPAAAYHALATALCCAEDAGDATWLSEVELIAQDATEQTDLGRRNLWVSLTYLARTKRQLLESVTQLTPEEPS